MWCYDSSNWKPPKYPVVGDLLNKWILLYHLMDCFEPLKTSFSFFLIFKDFGITG